MSPVSPIFHIVSTVNFWIVKVLKTINNHLITVLNRMDRLKHPMGIIFGWYIKKNSKKNLKSKINYSYRIGGTNGCITLNRRRLLCCVHYILFFRQDYYTWFFCEWLGIKYSENMWNGSSVKKTNKKTTNLL